MRQLRLFYRKAVLAGRQSRADRVEEAMAAFSGGEDVKRWLEALRE